MGEVGPLLAEEHAGEEGVVVQVEEGEHHLRQVGEDGRLGQAAGAVEEEGDECFGRDFAVAQGPDVGEASACEVLVV